MKVLVACEFSGVVRDAFIARGHDAWSCDLLPGNSERHLQCDVFDVLDNGWDLLIAHPPCTYLTNAGVRHLYSVPSKCGRVAEVNRAARWLAMDDAARFFCLLLNARIARIAVENPIPHHYAVQRIGRKYDQLIQPWQYGHNETKATCLWLRNLPLLKSTEIVGVTGCRPGLSHRLSPSPNRARLRSITYKGIAEAMASQWGLLS